MSLRELDLKARIEACGGSPDRVDVLRQLLSKAVFQIAGEEHSVGILTDSTVDREILEEASERATFVARSVDSGRGQPRDHDDTEFGVELRNWNGDIVPTTSFDIDFEQLPAEAEQRWHRLARLSRTSRLMEREVLIELCLKDGSTLTELELERLIVDAYRVDVRPEYWMLPELTDPRGWSRIAELILERDSSCRGYFVRPGADSGSRQEEFVYEMRQFACRGIVLRDVCDPSVLSAWLSRSLNNAEFTNALRVELRRMIPASPLVST